MKTKTAAAGFFAALFFLFSGTLYGQDLVAQYRASAERNYVLKDYEKAFDHVNFVLRAYVNKDAPEDVKNLGEKIYFSYLEEIVRKEAWAKLSKVKDSLLRYPAAGSNRVQALLRQGEAKVRELEEAEKRKQEEARLAQEEAKRKAAEEKALQEERRREAEREAARQKEREEYLAKEKALQEEKARLEAKQKAELDKVIEDLRKREAEREAMRERERQDSLRREEAIRAEQTAQRERERQDSLRREESIRKEREAQEARLKAELGKIADTSSAGKDETLSTGLKLGIYVVIGLGILGFLFVGGMIAFIFLLLRHNRAQQEQFQSTVNSFQAMTSRPVSERAALPLPLMDAPALPAPRQLRLEDRSNGPAPQVPQSPQERLGELLKKCADYSSEIDRVTGRKNASRNVAELVYKISKAKGLAEFDSLLNFAAALIYDIGFLSQEEALFKAEHITAEQFEALKYHTKAGASMVLFVEEEFRPLFADAVLKHHENMDGSGYPAGLKGEAIPFIARAIRVAESYVALISSRGYKQIRDKNSAMQELYAGKDLYDLDLVKTLDAIL